MSIPAVLPLLSSVPISPARSSRAESIVRLAEQGGVLAAPPRSAMTANWRPHLAVELHHVFTGDGPEGAQLSWLLDLANPAGLAAATALLELVEESTAVTADLVDSVAFWALRTGNMTDAAYLSAAAVSWALRGDGHRRLGQALRAEAAFEMAFELLAGSTDAAATARVEQLFARYERSRDAARPALLGFERALSAYRLAGDRLAVLDTAAELVATYGATHRPAEAEASLALLRDATERYFVGLTLEREMADLTSRGRDAAAHWLEAVVQSGAAGLFSSRFLDELALLAAERIARHRPWFGPEPTVRDAAAEAARLFGQITAAERMSDPVAATLHELFCVDRTTPRSLPADLYTPLVFFIPRRRPAAQRRAERDPVV